MDVMIINWLFPFPLLCLGNDIAEYREKKQVPGDLSGPEAFPLSNRGHKPRVVALNGDPRAWEAEMGGLPSV